MDIDTGLNVQWNGKIKGFIQEEFNYKQYLIKIVNNTSWKWLLWKGSDEMALNILECLF